MTELARGGGGGDGEGTRSDSCGRSIIGQWVRFRD